MHKIIKLTYQQPVIRAVFIDQNDSLRNMPMYNNTIHVSKNVTSTIGLEIRRVDRKLIHIDSTKLFFLNVISNDGESFIIRKQFNIFNLEKGQLKIDITPEDIEVIPSGRYTYSVTMIQDNKEILLHISANSNTYDEFIIDERSMPVQKPPFVQTILTRVRTNRESDQAIPFDEATFISSRLPITKDLHILSLDMTDFSGKILIQTTREVDPTDQVSFNTKDTFTFSTETSSQTFELQPNSDEKFYRIRIITANGNEGSIDKLTYM